MWQALSLVIDICGALGTYFLGWLCVEGGSGWKWVSYFKFPVEIDDGWLAASAGIFLVSPAHCLTDFSLAFPFPNTPASVCCHTFPACVCIISIRDLCTSLGNWLLLHCNFFFFFFFLAATRFYGR